LTPTPRVSATRPPPSCRRRCRKTEQKIILLAPLSPPPRRNKEIGRTLGLDVLHIVASSDRIISDHRSTVPLQAARELIVVSEASSRPALLTRRLSTVLLQAARDLIVARRPSTSHERSIDLR
jgi:hypothetical protein